MSILKAQLKEILERHEGRDRAITAKTLCHIFKLKDDRPIRLAIREFIADGMPIASSTEKPAGYFLVTTRQEANEYAQSIKGRLIEDAIRRRDFRRAADCYLTPAEQGILI